MTAPRMTVREFVRQAFPEASEEEAHDLLWSATAYPMCGNEHALAQLHESRLKANCPEDALRIADAEMSHQWEEGRAERDAAAAIAGGAQ